MSDLKTLMKVQADACRKEFEQDGELGPPVWLLENKDGIRMVLMMPMGAGDDRDAIADVVRKAIREFGAVRYSYACEMWFSHAKEGEPFTPPRNAPDRGEGILISGEDASGDLRTMIFEIRRRQGSKPWLEGPEVMTDVSGRFTNMFAVGPYL